MENIYFTEDCSSYRALRIGPGGRNDEVWPFFQTKHIQENSESVEEESRSQVVRVFRKVFLQSNNLSDVFGDVSWVVSTDYGFPFIEISI